MTIRRAIPAVLCASLLVSCQGGGAIAPIVRSTPFVNTDETFVPAGAPLPVLQASLTSDPTDDESFVPALAPPGGAILRRSANTIVLRVPAPPQGPRRVGIQVGHWRTEEAPPELRKLIPQTGAIWAGVNELDVNLDVAQRVAALLSRRGIVVDLLPSTIPVGYVADAFLALHTDSDGVGELSGFKLAHGPERGPYEGRLVADIKDAYGSATGMGYDGEHIGLNMLYYYPFNWSRFQHAAAAHTPAAILEMGYLSSDDDRAVLTDDPDRVAGAIANGLLRFLSETPRAQIFKDDLVIPLPPVPAPSTTP
jgi:N-acetylmuramoyl-L-alanine amidase